MTTLQAHASLVGQIVATVKYISSEFLPVDSSVFDEDDFSLAAERIGSETHVVSILGDRGTGKSTLLVNALTRLREKENSNFVVLPPLSPELFGDTDTLLNVVLAAVHQWFRTHEAMGDDEARLEFLRRLQAAKRSAAMNALPYDQLRRSASSVSEEARELQDLAGGTEQLWQDVQRLFTSLLSLCKSATAVIIPVDDADMMKTSAQLDLVRQIRLLGGCRHVIPIIALKEGEIARQMKREVRGEFYPGLGLKADIDPDIERVVTDVVNQQMRKTFPQWAIFRMPEPSWRERVAFRPRDEKRHLATLLQPTRIADESGPAVSPVVSNLLLTATGSVEQVLDDGTFTHPLPVNMRKLTQLWSALRLATILQSGQQAPVVLAHIVRALQDTVDRPFGIQFPLEGDFTAIESADDGPTLIATVNYRGIYGGVQAGDWLDLTDTPGQRSRSRADPGVSYDLRPFARLVPRWRVSSSTVPDYEDEQGALSMVLAIQGILLDSPNVRLGPVSRLTYGVSFESIRFLQSVSLAGISTDDAFITFPHTSYLISTARAIAAWSQMVERARRDQLSLTQLLTLSIWVSIAIFLDDVDPDVDGYSTDYGEAFLAASERAEKILLARAAWRTPEISARHFLAWYQYWVPAHWHEALFAPEEIRKFIDRILVVSGGEIHADAPDPMYASRSLSTRLEVYCNDAGTEDGFERSAWIGGYRQVVEGLGINLPPTWREFIVPVWQRAASVPRVGGVAVAQSIARRGGGEAAFTDGTIDRFSIEGEAEPAKGNAKSAEADRTDGTVEQFAIEGEAELLVAYVTARLRRWART